MQDVIRFANMPHSRLALAWNDGMWVNLNAMRQGIDNIIRREALAMSTYIFAKTIYVYKSDVLTPEEISIIMDNMERDKFYRRINR